VRRSQHYTHPIVQSDTVVATVDATVQNEVWTQTEKQPSRRALLEYPFMSIIMRAAISRIEKPRSHVALSFHCTPATSIKVHAAGNKLWYSGVVN
jgi:hypothetical protein